MKKHLFRNLFNAAVVLVMAAVVITAMGFNRQAALLPLIVGVPTLIIAIANMIVEFRESMAAAVAERGAKSETPKGEGEEKSKVRKEIVVSLWVLALFVCLYLFGFIATTFFYTFLSLKVRSRFGWKVSLGVSTGCLLFLYVLLIYALDVDLYQGVVVLALRKAMFGY